MYITYGKVFGGLRTFFMLWLFPEKGSILERTVNRALIVNNSIKFCINKKININFHFHHVPKLSMCFNCLLLCFPPSTIRINHVEDSIVERTNLPDELIRDVTGTDCVPRGTPQGEIDGKKLASFEITTIPSSQVIFQSLLCVYFISKFFCLTHDFLLLYRINCMSFESVLCF